MGRWRCKLLLANSATMVYNVTANPDPQGQGGHDSPHSSIVKTEDTNTMSRSIIYELEVYAKLDPEQVKEQSMPRRSARVGFQGQIRNSRTRGTEQRAAASRPRTRATNTSRQASVSAAMANERRSSQGTRQYMFIDSEADRSTSNEAIRVHVMRESHRARRQLRGLLEPQGSYGQMTILSPTMPTAPRPDRTQSLPDLARESPTRDVGLPPSPQREQTPSADLKSLAQSSMSTLREVTGGKFSSACAGLGILRTLPDNIFDLCENDPAALHSLIALVMSVQSTVNVLHAAESESSALEILRSRISSSTSAAHSDETMMTVFLLSRLERSRSNNDTAVFHEAALERMIHDRGGYNQLQTYNPALYAMLGSCGLGNDA